MFLPFIIDYALEDEPIIHINEQEVQNPKEVMENLKSIINEEESKLTDRSDSDRPRYEDYVPLRSSSQDSRENDAFSSQIDNLRKQSQAAKEEDSRKTTASPKNNFADASTSNGSETEEKFDSKKKLEKLNKTQATEIDEWAFFEESENKVSKSSKKRQKRKLKKKAIQESLKAQEEQSKSELDDVTSPKADDLILSKENSKLTQEDNKVIPSPISNEKETQEATNSNGNSRKGSESEKSNAPEEEVPKSSWKEDSTLKNPSFPINPQEFDDFGFIEVKAKKKTEKEKKSKGKKDGKESWRKNKEKEPVEKKRPPPKENPNKAKSVIMPTEPIKKVINNVKQPEKVSTTPIQKVVTTVEKTTEGGNTKPKNKETTKVSLIIPSTTTAPTTKPKVLTPPSLKTAVSNPPASASGSASESETTSCTSKEVSQTSTSSNVNASENNNNNNHHHNHTSHSAPKSGHNNNGKGYKVYHPLSLTSPSLDPETIRIAKVKEYANEFFNKKFKNDIFKHVSDLTEGSNTIMKYRILAYQRLDYCIAKLFPSTWIT